MHITHTPLDILSLSEDIVFLDIETTGLSKTQNSIFCIGLLSFTHSRSTITQFFAASPDQEKLLLITFLEKIKPYTMMFTYGGSHFDVSFITEKLSFYDLDTSLLLEKRFIDFKKIPLIKGLLTYAATTRSEFEQKLGYNRTLCTSGKDLIKTYKLWQTHKTPIYSDIFLTHNKEELIGLYHFYDLYKINNYMLYQKNYTYVNSQTGIKLNFCMDTPLTTTFKFYKDDFNLSWKKETPSVDFHIYCPLRSLKRYLTPASDYFFIEGQNQIVHKSIAQFIPTSLKKKVSKKDCYLCSSGHFIRTYTTKDISEPLWYDDFKNAYLPFNSDSNTSTPLIKKAALSVITYCLRGLKA